MMQFNRLFKLHKLKLNQVMHNLYRFLKLMLKHNQKPMLMLTQMLTQVRENNSHNQMHKQNNKINQKITTIMMEEMLEVKVVMKDHH